MGRFFLPTCSARRLPSILPREGISTRPAGEYGAKTGPRGSPTTISLPAGSAALGLVALGSALLKRVWTPAWLTRLKLPRRNRSLGRLREELCDTAGGAVHRSGDRPDL